MASLKTTNLCFDGANFWFYHLNKCKGTLTFYVGGANEETDKTPAEALALRKAGVHIVVVAVGDDMNLQMLKSIASFPYSENLLSVRRSRELPGIIEKAHKTVCNGKS